MAQNPQTDRAESNQEESQPEDYDQEQSVLDRNYEIFQQLEHREVIIRSNRYDDEDREYYVEEVERTYIDGATGNIPSVRLKNDSVRPSLQPVLKMPRSIIPVEEDGDKRTLNLIYSHDPSVEQSFYYMNRYERPDLEIYISYSK